MKNLFNIVLVAFLGCMIVSCGGNATADTTSATAKATAGGQKSITPDAGTKSALKKNPRQQKPMPAGGEAEMPWVKLDKVESLVKAEKKKVLVDVYTSWCGPCKMMDRMTFTNQEVVDAVSKSFYPVKYNAEGPDKFTFMGKEYGNPNFDPKKTRGRNARHELASYFAVRGYPTMVVMDENMKIIDKIVGFQKPDQLLASLKKHM